MHHRNTLLSARMEDEGRKPGLKFDVDVDPLEMS